MKSKEFENVFLKLAKKHKDASDKVTKAIIFLTKDKARGHVKL